jgi:hypothetical protein
LKNSPELTQKSFSEQILRFVESSPGLKSVEQSSEKIQIYQEVDGKTIIFSSLEVEEVIPRVDGEGQAFLQINFHSGKKILITESLIGFKPAESVGLDMSKLPKVVTTPDLISVVEAIEEAMHTSSTPSEELDILRQVFDAVLRGAETVGFDLKSERIWLQQLAKNPQRASA